MRDVDLAIVGAGPAGAAAALRARQLDPTMDVVLLDRADFPRDKVCGDGLGPEGVDVLRTLGVAEQVLGDAPALQDVRITAPSGAEVRGRAPRPGYVIPRMVLDARLHAAAVAAGAEPVRHRVRQVREVNGHVEVDDAFRARTLVAADGANSVVRSSLGIAPQPPAHTGVAIRGYADAPHVDDLWIAFVEQRWPAYAWAFPIGDGRVNVGYGPFDTRRADKREALLETLVEVTGITPDLDTVKGHRLPLSTHRPRAALGRVLLAGDAASMVHPLTGEGIYYALLMGASAGAAAVRFDDDPGRAHVGALRHRLGGHLRDLRLAARLFASTYPVEVSLRAAATDPRAFGDLCEFALGTGRLTPRLVADLTRAGLRKSARNGR